MSGDTPLWRYLTLDAVIATIEARHLRLTRVDRFQDPFEGSVPKKQIEDQIPILIGAASRRAMLNSVAAHYPGMERSRPPDEDPWLRITRLRRFSRELQQRGAEVVYGNLLNFDAMRSALAEVDRTYFCYPISPGIVQAVGRRTTFARRPTVTGQIVGRYRDSHRRRRDCMARADSGRIHS